jgi:Fic family protein
MLHAYPDLDLEDTAVLAEISAMRTELADFLRVPRRWAGRLRRTALARAIRGSNSIEGYLVELDDADASLDGEEPLSADQRTFAEIRGYRQALGYVLTMARDEHFRIDASAIRSMHFMMLSHDVAKSPGQYRETDIYVHDDRTDQIAYTGPDATEVPVLMSELVNDLDGHAGEDPVVQAAMAHLNLVMIHPFRDGNGRMARALQTMVLAQKGIAEPEFSSIEEWLGANTEDYYRVLAATGRGSWNPDADAHLWVSFNLRAHHLQAQTVRNRWTRAQRTYVLLDELVSRHRLPERVVDPLYTALFGFRLRRPTYVEQSGVDERTASRDFKALADLDLLRPVGETKGRHYVRGDALEPIRQEVGRNEALQDPYPWMKARLLELTTA